MLKNIFLLSGRHFFLIGLTLSSLFLTNPIYGQVISYIGTFNNQGVPDYLEATNDPISADFLNRIEAAVPENYPVPTYHPSYLTANFQASLDIVATTDVYITYLAEGAGYKNVLGFYKYPTASPPTSASEVDTVFIAFPNVSKVGGGGGLVPGNKVNIGSFTAGTTIGFYLISNGYSSSTNSVGSGLFRLFSDKNLNDHTDITQRQQTIVLYDDITDKYVICYEDIKRPSGDKDFNDAIFYATASESGAIQENEIAGLPAVWTGAVDSDWNNPANWNPASVPDSTDNVSIPAGTPNAPVISSNVNLDAITIDPSATISVDPDAVIVIKGDLTSTSQDLTSGTVKLDGTGEQYIFGDIEINHLIIESGDRVVIENSLDITETLEVNEGILETNDAVTLKTQASLLEQANGSIDGTITIEGEVSAPDGYHYISSPLQNQTLAAINDDYTLVGLGGDLSTSPFPNIWMYDETDVSPHSYDGWVTPGSTTQEMTPGSGFALNIPTGKVIDFTGVPNTGDITLPLTHTISPGEHGEHCPPDGWHLLGNPYPTPIDWSVVNAQNIDGGLYVWSPDHGQYATYIDGIGVMGGTKYIATMQGFFIRTNHDDSTITAQVEFSNAMKVSNKSLNINFKTVPDSLIRLQLTGPNGRDETVVRFTDNSTNDYDKTKDAYKMKNQNALMPNFSSSTIGFNQELSVNSIPDLTETTEITLNIEAGSAGDYSINVDLMSPFMNYGDAWIKDDVTGSLHALTGGAFHIYLNDQESTTRYKLVVDNQLALGIEKTPLDDNEAIQIFMGNNGLILSSKVPVADLKIMVYSFMGQLIYNGNMKNINDQPQTLYIGNLAQGGYVIKTIYNGQIQANKVVNFQ
jgi:hypothetical protein